MEVSKMSSIWKKATIVLLVLALVAAFGFSCGNGEKKTTTIIIGAHLDLTGPAAPALTPGRMALEDVVRYCNDENLIPGVRLKVVFYDGNLKPSRDVPGWDWLKNKGAQVIITAIPFTTLTLKSFAERDRVPIISLSNTEAFRVPPGWVFCPPPSFGDQVKTVLDWVGKSDWTEARPARIGVFQWDDPAAKEITQKVKDWCQAHSGKFEFVASVTAPMGSMLLGSAQTEPLKNCDYVFLFGTGAPYFMKAYRQAGHTATFLGDSSISSNSNFLGKLVGWDGLDGTLTAEIEYWWDEQHGTIPLSKELIQRYRPGEASDLIGGGKNYKGFTTLYMGVLQILEAAINEVGIENFDGQAFYNACLTTTVRIDGYPDMSYGQTKRESLDYIKIYEWKADGQHLVSRSDWIPLIRE